MKVSENERSFLRMLFNADGRHRFGIEDSVTSEMHRMLRRLKSRGYVQVEEENGITTVTLLPAGREEVEHG